MVFLSTERPIFMGILNLTPDSFFAPSRACCKEAVLLRLQDLFDRGCSIFDLGAVSTRPGAEPVSLQQEWERLEPALPIVKQWIEGKSRAQANAPTSSNSANNLASSARAGSPTSHINAESSNSANSLASSARAGSPTSPDIKLYISIDTYRSEIVRQAFKLIGPFIVNDISAGEHDPAMLTTVAELGLPYIAMHKRGNPCSMDTLTDYPQGVTRAVLNYFEDFSLRAEAAGINNWILDPGFGFAKNNAQNWELLHNLQQFKRFGKPLLAGVADKRFTKDPLFNQGDPKLAENLATKVADIVRIH